MLIELLIGIDILSALAMLGVAAAFFSLWRFTKGQLHLLFAVAFGMLGIGISLVGTSEFDLSRAAALVDGLRIFCHTAAPLMIALGYWAARHDEPVRLGFTVGLAFVLAAVMAALIWIVPPFGSFTVGSTRGAFILAHAVQFLLYIGIVLLSGRNFLRDPRPRRALVPLAFVAYAFSKYTWLLIDLSDDQSIVPLIYFWRFLMLALMGTAVFVPLLRRGSTHAEA